MKVIISSDFHGELPNIIEKFDLFLICGDICPVENHRLQYQSEWIKTVFVKWVDNLPFKDENSKVVMIAGNHDFIFESISQKKIDKWVKSFKDNRLVYLDNEEYIFNGYKIFGSPYCKVYGRWAFMKDNLEKYYDFIPNDVDILITHDAADINGLGLINMGRQEGVNAGNKVLAEYVLKTKPKYYFCGHIHSGKHSMFEKNGINMANVSYLNEYYTPHFKPLILEMEEKNSED